MQPQPSTKEKESSAIEFNEPAKHEYDKKEGGTENDPTGSKKESTVTPAPKRPRPRM